MHDILNKIVAHKKVELAERQSARAFAEIKSCARRAPPARGFAQSLARHARAGRAAVIAEIKKASPSQGVLRAEVSVAEIASRYAQAGASCLSVLTDKKFFQGDDADIAAARRACELPVLRKDFTLDAYQVYEARALGADAVLLIAALFDAEQLYELAELALQLGMDALIEVHNQSEWQTALDAPARALIGVNNRDLRTFKVDIETTLNLAADAPPERMLVSESGIKTAHDVRKLRDNGVRAFLVGETLMRAADPGEKLRELFDLHRVS